MGSHNLFDVMKVDKVQNITPIICNWVIESNTSTIVFQGKINLISRNFTALFRYNVENSMDLCNELL